MPKYLVSVDEKIFYIAREIEAKDGYKAAEKYKKAIDAGDIGVNDSEMDEPKVFPIDKNGLVKFKTHIAKVTGKLTSDKVISVVRGRNLVGVYWKGTDGSEILFETTKKKADAIIKIFNAKE